MNRLPDAIFDVIDRYPLGVSTEEVGYHVGLSLQSMGDAIEYLKSERAIFGFAGFWLTERHLVNLIEPVRRLTNEAHAAAPAAEGHSGPAILREVGLDWPEKSRVRLAEALIQQGTWRGEPESVRTPEFRMVLTPRQEELVQRVLTHFPDEALTTPSAGELIDLIPAPVQAVEEIMRLGDIGGYWRTIAPGVWYTPTQLEIIFTRLERWAEDYRDGFTIAEFREATGISRKYADALIGYFRFRGALENQGSRLVVT